MFHHHHRKVVPADPTIRAQVPEYEETRGLASTLTTLQNDAPPRTPTAVEGVRLCIKVALNKWNGIPIKWDRSIFPKNDKKKPLMKPGRTLNFLALGVFPRIVLLSSLSLIGNMAQAHDGQTIRGDHFDGVIATPPMLTDFHYCEGNIFSTELWTPSPALVRQAESRLPHAIAQCTAAPKTLGTYYVPRFYTPKVGSPVSSVGHERVETDVADSKQDNFLYDVRPILSDYKRQYIGVTVKGTKYLLMSFVHASCISDPYVKKTWGHSWVEALGGGDLFWRVLYDPASGTFSDWVG